MSTGCLVPSPHRSADDVRLGRAAMQSYEQAAARELRAVARSLRSDATLDAQAVYTRLQQGLKSARQTAFQPVNERLAKVFGSTPGTAACTPVEGATLLEALAEGFAPPSSLPPRQQPD